MNETKRTVKEAMGDVRQAVPSYTYRLFLKVMTSTVGRLMNTTNAISSLNCLEMNFCSLDTETSTVRHLVYLLGYEDVHTLDAYVDPRYKFVMLDVRSSRHTLRAFLELAAEEVACSTIPGVTELQAIDSVPYLIAHLGYNLHLRLELMLFVSRYMMPLMDEDILVALKCIEYLATRLGVLVDGGNTVAVWDVAKAMVEEFLASRGSSCEVSVLREILKDVASRFTIELSLMVSSHLSHILLFTNSVELTVHVTNGRIMLTKGDTRRYLKNFGSMPTGFVSNRFVTSYESMERLMRRSLEYPLTDSEVEEVYKLAVWQSQHFIYHVQPEAVVPTDVGCQLDDLERGSRVDPYVLESMLAATQQVHADASDRCQPSLHTLVAKGDKEKGKHGLCEKEKTADNTDSDATTQEQDGSLHSDLFHVAPASSMLRDTCSTSDREKITTPRDDSSRLISILNDSIESACSSDVLAHTELDLNRTYERSNLRKTELDSNLQDLTDAVASISSPVVVYSLKEKLEETRQELEIETRLHVDLETLRDRLAIKQQSLACQRPPLTLTLLPVCRLQDSLHGVLLYHRQQEQLGVAVLLQLLVRSLKFFSYDDVTVVQRELRMVPQDVTEYLSTQHECIIKEIAHHCSQLVRRLLLHSHCPL